MDTLVRLAKSSLEYFIRTGNILSTPTYIPSELMRQRACYIYVFQKPGRHLRSLYGSALPRHQSLAQEVIKNSIGTIHFASRVIKKSDLSSLIYRVAVLDPIQRISDQIHLDPLLYGLYLTTDKGKSALVLPNRIGIDTPNDQVALAIREAGILPHQEVITMYRFLVTQYE